MPSDDGVAVGLVAHYLCPVPVSCIMAVRRRRRVLVGRPKAGGRMEDAICPSLSARVCWQGRVTYVLDTQVN